MKKITAALAATMLVIALAPGAAAAASCFGRRATIVGTTGDDVIRGTPGSDVIVARDGDDKVRGGGGADRICGDAGNDRLLGGSGSDRIEMGRIGWMEVASGGDGADLLVGGSRNGNCDGIWRLKGGRGDDRFRAEPGTVCVTMEGGFGDDDLDTGSGSGTMIGGPDDDTMTGSGFFEGGAGDDHMSGDSHSRVVFDDPGGVSVDLAAGTATGPGEGRDTIAGIATVLGSDGDDVIKGDAGANGLYGGAGEDRILGGDGADSIFGQAGDDEVDGGPGDDRVSAVPGNDVVGGGADDDFLTNEVRPDVRRDPAGSAFDGGAGRDWLYLSLHPAGSKTVSIDLAGVSSMGGVPLALAGIEDVTVYGNDPVELYGDEGPNRLQASGTETVIEGRGGDDVLDPDGVVNTVDGGAGTDLADFNGPWPVVVDLADGTFSEPHRSGTVAGIENVFGSTGDDVIRGDDGPNLLRPSFGNDTAEGRGGDDVLEGSLGDDHLDGGDGTDTLDGDVGTDECVNGESVRNCEG